MAITITVKNTFLNLERSTEGPVRRSTSVPRAFKPGDSCSDDSTRSDDSTSVSENDFSDKFLFTSSDSDCEDSCQDFPDCCSACTEDECDFMYPHKGASQQSIQHESPTSGSKHETLRAFLLESSTCDSSDCCSGGGKVTLSLVDMVGGSQGTSRSKLKPQARPFKSVRAPPAEVAAVIADAVEALYSGQNISDVQVNDGGMGGTTMIVAKSSGANANASSILPLVKDTLLSSAERSESTYILGYGAQPFNTLDDFSFSANIACVPLAHRGMTCWDTYEKGFCPRCTTCRWSHPSDMDKMRLIVMIQNVA